jgi:hypothetical protein
LNGASGISPTQLLSLIGSLQGVSGLPAPLGGLVSQVTSALGGSGSIFGAVPGLSSGQVTGALTALQALPGLPAGASVPGGALAPVGAILTQIAAQPGVPAPVAGALNTLAGTLNGAGALSPTSLRGVIALLQAASGSLPAPLATVVSQLAGSLGAAGSLTGTGAGTGAGGTGTGSGGTGAGTGTGGGGSGTGATGYTAAQIRAYYIWLANLIAAQKAAAKKKAAHSGHANITRVRRSGNQLIITLSCSASANRTCKTTLAATTGSRQMTHKTLTFRGGSSKRVTLLIPASATRALARHRITVKVIARTGSYRTSKTLR